MLGEHKMSVAMGLAALLINAGSVLAGTFVEIVNPGFDRIEDGKAAGWTSGAPAWRAERGGGVNGSGGLVYETESAQHGSRPTQELSLKTGRKYRLSAKVIADGLFVDRPDSPSQGMTVMLSWFDASGKWLGECVAAPGAKGRMDDWATASAITPDMPANAVRFTLQPYVCGHGVGKGRIDDIVVEAVEMKPIETVTSSAYRNEAVDGRVRFAAVVNWVDDIPQEEQRVYFVYCDHAGKLTKKEGCKVPNGVVAEVEVADLAVGTNDVRCVLRARGKTLANERMRFARLKQAIARRAWIDAKKRLIVDGKPFFPLGLYTGRMDEKAAAEIASGPFNCIGPYTTPSKEMLDVYERHGLKVIYSLCWAEREAEYFPSLRRKITEFAKNHPAVIGWYICDEPTLGKMPAIVAWRKEIEALDDGGHPIWGCLCAPGEVRHFLDAFDVLGVDPYPVPRKPLTYVTEVCRAAESGMFGTKAMWNVPQAFAWGWLGRRENRGERAPTKEEMANMFWQMIANGANGLIGYGYSHMKDKSKIENPEEAFEKFWPRVCAAAAEVRRYERVLLLDGDTPGLEVSDARVACRAWREENGDVYLLAVNSMEEAVDAKVTLSERFLRIAECDFGSRPVCDGNLVACSLPPLGYVMVHLVKGDAEGVHVRAEDFPSISAAVAACSARGGGKVRVTPGVHRSNGPLVMKSNVELCLEEGAVVEFSDRPEDYLPGVRTTCSGMECYAISPLVYAYGCTNIAITGRGTLKARMDFWWNWSGSMPKDLKVAAKAAKQDWLNRNAPVEERQIWKLPNASFRPKFLHFNRCKNIRLEDFSVRGSPNWTIHVFLSEDVTARNLDVDASGDDGRIINNSDGFDIDSSRNVLIENCTFCQGDDAVVFKSGKDEYGRRLGKPTENVVVRNCTVRKGHNLAAIGSELSGGVRNVTISNCRVIGKVGELLNIKTNRRRGGFVENIRLEDITVDEVRYDVVGFNTRYYFGGIGEEALEEDYLTPIQGLVIRNVHCRKAPRGLNLRADYLCPAEDVSVEKLIVDECEVADYVANVKGFRRDGKSVMVPGSVSAAELGASDLSAAIWQPETKEYVLAVTDGTVDGTGIRRSRDRMLWSDPQPAFLPEEIRRDGKVEGVRITKEEDGWYLDFLLDSVPCQYFTPAIYWPFRPKSVF